MKTRLCFWGGELKFLLHTHAHVTSLWGWSKHRYHCFQSLSLFKPIVDIMEGRRWDSFENCVWIALPRPLLCHTEPFRPFHIQSRYTIITLSVNLTWWIFLFLHCPLWKADLAQDLDFPNVRLYYARYWPGSPSSGRMIKVLQIHRISWQCWTTYFCTIKKRNIKLFSRHPTFIW